MGSRCPIGGEVPSYAGLPLRATITISSARAAVARHSRSSSSESARISTRAKSTASNWPSAAWPMAIRAGPSV